MLPRAVTRVGLLATFDSPSQQSSLVFLFGLVMQKLICRKLGLFGHICRMHNNRMIKELMFGRMEGTNKRGRPRREWLDDIIKWGGMSLQKLSQMASDRGS